jgi:4-hydroxy 2-oxovalerate aldolase
MDENKKLKKEREQKDAAMQDGMMVLLKIQLIEYHSKYMGSGDIPSYVYDNFDEMYKVYETLKFIENYMLQLKKDGVVWGYDVPYLVTGYLNQHPRAAMAFSKDKRTDYSKFFDEVIAQE